MKNVASIALKSGMEIAEDVYSYKNELLVPSGTKVDERVMEKLAHYRVVCVSIKDEIDYATTHFEKVRLSSGFKTFEIQYSKSLLLYKAIMINFSTNNIPFHMSQLMNIYQDIASCASTDVKLLDYLYNMIPSEDDMTHAHCLNSALIAGVFAKWFGLNKQDSLLLIQCAFCYDLGKLKLTNELLWKPAKLTEEEYARIKTHPVLGYQMLQNQNLDPHILAATLMHHERIDGTGYPRGLTDVQIDPFAKYIAIIDTYEAMTSARTYRQSQNVFKVIQNFEDSGRFKYDDTFLKPILQHLAQSQLGFTVSLNNDLTAEVILINDTKLSRPLLKAGEELIDLRTNPQLVIQNVY